MRDELATIHPRRTECAVVNLDSMSGPGTHWVAYYKKGSLVQYFDSFGNLKPPKELMEYFKNCCVTYNYERVQQPTDTNCGHLCLQFLYNKIAGV